MLLSSPRPPQARWTSTWIAFLGFLTAVARSICFGNARDAGYATKVILISTEDPNLNVGRILIRMTLGGQSVPLVQFPIHTKNP